MKIEFFVAKVNRIDCNDEEIKEVLIALDLFLDKNKATQTQIVRLVVFYNPTEIKNYPELLLGKIKEHFKFAVPAISFIAQPPLGKGNLIIEVSYVTDSVTVIKYKKHKNIHYTIAEHDFQKHIFISGLQSTDTNKSIQVQSEESFQALESIFNEEGFAFTDIIRQWNYIEGIISENDNDQNYQIFNDVRTKYYNKNGLTSNYPAATGIGIQEGGIIIDVHALKATKELQLAEITNPLQIDAYAYSEKVLEGKPLDGFKKKTTPKFSRAKWVANSNSALILVSGTASIHGEETIGLNDVEKQTHFTIKNIFQLINLERLTKLNAKCKDAIINFTNVRVYVKNENDMDIVQKVCDEYFTTPNIAFFVADICRENLLVEIEGTVSINFVH